MAEVTPATVKRHKTQMESRYATAHQYWRVWDELIHRGIAPVTDPRLGNIAMGADYRSPDLEDEEQKYIDFLSQAITEIEAVPGLDSPTGRDEARISTLFFNRLWAQINQNRRVTRMWSNGQVRHGVKAWRLLYRNLKPPKDIEGKEAIEKWMKTRSDVFYTRNVDNYAVFRDPISNDVQRVIWEYDLSVYDAADDMRTEGSKIGKDDGMYYVPIHDAESASGMRWVGEEESPDHESNGDEVNADKKLRVTVYEYLDQSEQCPVCPSPHALWKGMEVIRGEGKNVDQGETVHRYTLPYKRYGSLRFVDGRVADLDQDVLHHNRPLMYKMIVEGTNYNWAIGMLQAIANNDATMPDVIRLNTTLPDAANELVKGMSVPLSDQPAKGEGTPVIPGEPLKWPTGLTEGLIRMAELALERFQAAKLPEILFGGSLEEAVKGGTIAAVLMRQARIPFDTSLAQQSQAIVDMMEDIKHAIMYWGDAESGIPEQRFYVSLEGNEGEGEAGQVLYLSASKLTTAPIITVKSNAETLAEQQAREEAAWTKLQRGGIDFEQYLREIGFKDAKAQANRLGMQADRELAQPMMQQAKMHAMRTMAVTLFDMDDPFLFDQTGMEQPPQQQGGGGDTGMAAPTIRPPALNGTQQTPAGGVQ